jgi:hypothetical protein
MYPCPDDFYHLGFPTMEAFSVIHSGVDSIFKDLQIFKEKPKKLKFSSHHISDFAPSVFIVIYS